MPKKKKAKSETQDIIGTDSVALNMMASRIQELEKRMKSLENYIFGGEDGEKNGTELRRKTKS
jgi:hypothetical protein